MTSLEQKVAALNSSAAMPSAMPADANDLRSRAMQVRLSIRVWTARKLDKRITDETNATHGATADAGRFNKLIIEKAALAPIEKIASAARAAHYARTAPWQYDGVGVIASAGFLAYAGAMRQFRQEFDAAADLFVANFAGHIATRRSAMGDMFRASDYPSEAEIRNRFAFSYSIDPIADSSDFRVALTGPQVAAIRADIESRAGDAVSDAMRDVWTRIADRVTHMATKLAEYKPAAGKGDKSEGIFRDSLVDNVRELVDLLPGLNVTGDARLAAIADRMAAELCQDDASALRTNSAARESVAKSAEAIAADVAAYLA